MDMVCKYLDSIYKGFMQGFRRYLRNVHLGLHASFALMFLFMHINLQFTHIVFLYIEAFNARY